MLDDHDDMNYARPPITEAVLELRFGDVGAQKVRKAGAAMKSRYENSVEDMLTEGKLDFNTRTSTFRDVSPRFVLSSDDQTDGFSITGTNAVWVRRAPYEGWGPFYARVEHQLPRVLKALGYPKITRMGLRFVNRIDFPVRDGLGYHEDYLTFNIDGGPLLEPHNGYKWILQKDFPELHMAALVQSATVEPELPNHLSILFDIDVYATVDAPSKSDDILSALCNMRKLKNKIFEAGVTDEARKLFNAAND